MSREQELRRRDFRSRTWEWSLSPVAEAEGLSTSASSCPWSLLAPEPYREQRLGRTRLAPAGVGRSRSQVPYRSQPVLSGSLSCDDKDDVGVVERGGPQLTCLEWLVSPFLRGGGCSSQRRLASCGGTTPDTGCLIKREHTTQSSFFVGQTRFPCRISRVEIPFFK